VNVQLIVDLIACVAGLVAILDYFGVKPKRRAEGEKLPLSRKWKLVIMLLLVGISLGLSGYSFYRAYKPKIVERVIEKQIPVEKVVQKDCPPNIAPKPSSAKLPKKHTSKSTVSTSGGDSPAVGSITQGTGSALSFNQKGGITAGTIIGKIPPPARQLPTADIDALTSMLAKHPGNILILYAQHDEEAYSLAKQIGDMLTAAGWTLKQPVTETMIVSSGGPPSYGIEIGFKGQTVPAGSPVTLDINTASGLLGRVLQHFFPNSFYATPSPNFSDNEVLLTIMENPMEKAANGF
jgi:hypothetical protein